MLKKKLKENAIIPEQTTSDQPKPDKPTGHPVCDIYPVFHSTERNFAQGTWQSSEIETDNL